MLVNRRAQGVTEASVAQLRAAVGDRLYVTETLDEAAVAAQQIVASGVGALAIGGGDGTFRQAAADLVATGGRVPVLLPLRLGTGNAIADVAGASRARRGRSS